MKSPGMLRAIWAAGGLALLLGVGRDNLLRLMPQPRELPRLDGATGKPWLTGDFKVGGIYPATAAGLLPANIQNAGSWVGSDEWQGRSETAWFKAKPWLIHVGVVGYPQHPGCKLWAEFRTDDGSVTRIDCLITDPREAWNVWEIHRPANAVAVRLVAEDRAKDTTGWIAFSHPFRAWPGAVTAGLLHVQLFATMALALVLVWGPGLLWFPRGASAEIRSIFIIGTGPLLLAALGAFIWWADGSFRPETLGLVSVTALWLAVGVGFLRRTFSLDVSATMRRVLGISALIVVAVTAKSAYSVGPPGELYRGTISHNLTVGDRIDARFPYYVVQAAAQHLGPAAPATEHYFYPWTFFSRGPLAGLATIPVVMATGGQPPVELPEQRWSPFDRQGFAAYRVTMIVLASEIIVAIFALLVPFVGEPWALLGAGLLALSPFGVHEVMFTWPKWVATAWLVLSFSLVHARRSLTAGVALAIGYLFHPLVLMWAPSLALWACGRSDRKFGAIFMTGFRFVAGVAVLVLPWMAAGAVAPHLPDTPFAGQGDFLRYWQLADRMVATWDTWWHTRWMNFANTFVPLHVYLSDYSFHHFRADSPYEPSGPLVKFAYVWWNSLPFGMGLGVWALSLVALCRAVQTFRAATWLFVIAPALLITANWGMDPLGLMRECGHPLFVAILALLCVVAAQSGGWLRSILLQPALPWLQLPETCLMLWLTTLANRHPWPVEYDQLDPLNLAINVLALLLVARVLAKHRQQAAMVEASAVFLRSNPA